eukprot:1373492-Pleurochrysis_carterae.AAC.3
MRGAGLVAPRRRYAPRDAPRELRRAPRYSPPHAHAHAHGTRAALLPQRHAALTKSSNLVFEIRKRRLHLSCFRVRK